MKQSRASGYEVPSMKTLLVDTAERAAQYLEGIAERRVAPLPADVARLEALGGPLPELPSDPAAVLSMLDEFGSPATVASAAGRYFGFVIGGSLPAALAANWLAAAWDQNAAMQVMSPVAAKLEEIVLGWMVDLLGLPSGSGAGFVTGTTMANFTSLSSSANRAVAACRVECRRGRTIWGAPNPRSSGRRGARIRVEGTLHARAGAFARDAGGCR